VHSTVTERTIAIGAAQLQAIPEVIGVPYGVAKAPAVRAALRGGIVTSLVTHASLASALLDHG
jgi:DNA-binding transcriptional regulator LsrR (DeoR family)